MVAMAKEGVAVIHHLCHTFLYTSFKCVTFQVTTARKSKLEGHRDDGTESPRRKKPSTGSETKSICCDVYRYYGVLMKNNPQLKDEEEPSRRTHTRAIFVKAV